MKKSRYSEMQIVRILKEIEAGKPVKDACREYGISGTTYYNWKAKYGGRAASDIQPLKEIEAGKPVKDACRDGISGATYYNWKAKYGGMAASDIQRLKDLEAENRHLKQMYVDLSLDHRILKDIVEKKV